MCAMVCERRGWPKAWEARVDLGQGDFWDVVAEEDEKRRATQRLVTQEGVKALARLDRLLAARRSNPLPDRSREWARSTPKFSKALCVEHYLLGVDSQSELAARMACAVATTHYALAETGVRLKSWGRFLAGGGGRRRVGRVYILLFVGAACPDCQTAVDLLTAARVKHDVMPAQTIFDGVVPGGERSEAMAAFCERAQRLPVVQIRTTTPAGIGVVWTDLDGLRERLGKK